MGGELAVARFRPGREIQEGGGDIRVLDALGKETPFAVVFASSGRTAEVIFRFAGFDHPYFIYYGNPGAKPPSPKPAAAPKAKPAPKSEAAKKPGAKPNTIMIILSRRLPVSALIDCV